MPGITASRFQEPTGLLGLLGATSTKKLLAMFVLSSVFEVLWLNASCEILSALKFWPRSYGLYLSTQEPSLGKILTSSFPCSIALGCWLAGERASLMLGRPDMKREGSILAQLAQAAREYNRALLRIVYTRYPYCYCFRS